MQMQYDAGNISGQSFTEEWKKLVDKIDKDIEKTQAEQAERLEKQQTDLAMGCSGEIVKVDVPLIKSKLFRNFCALFSLRYICCYFILPQALSYTFR